MENRIKPEIIAKEIWQTRYPNAQLLFLSGSVIRGEATKFSDLDIVVVFENVDFAWRESFIYKDWPIEILAHDINTLKYFIYEMDVKSGCPSLPQMIIESIPIPEANGLSKSLKQMASQIMEAGPPALNSNELKRKRYEVTDLIDDIRAPRSNSELLATGTQLFSALADFHLRSKGLWSASGKGVVRRLKTTDKEFYARFEKAFRLLFSESDPGLCIKIAEEILKDSGGFLFDGYRLDAPSTWKLD